MHPDSFHVVTWTNARALSWDPSYQRPRITLKLHVPARQGPSVNITVVVTGHRTRRSPCPLAPARVSQTGLSQERHPGPPPPVQGKQLGEWEMGSEP